jgi:DEAD/DEAH box helicase domain-containing protein
MCDPQDIGVHVERTEVAGVLRHAFAHGDVAEEGVTPDGERRAIADEQLPTIYIYERAAAGLGFSARLFELHTTLIGAAYDLIANCGCPQGCPACVGPVLENEAAQLDTKGLALALLRELTGQSGLLSVPSQPVARHLRTARSNDEVSF